MHPTSDASQYMDFGSLFQSPSMDRSLTDLCFTGGLTAGAEGEYDNSHLLSDCAVSSSSCSALNFQYSMSPPTLLPSQEKQPIKKQGLCVDISHTLNRQPVTIIQEDSLDECFSNVLSDHTSFSHSSLFLLPSSCSKSKGSNGSSISKPALAFRPKLNVKRRIGVRGKFVRKKKKNDEKHSKKQSNVKDSSSSSEKSNSRCCSSADLTNGAANAKTVILASNYISDFVDDRKRYWLMISMNRNVLEEFSIMCKTRRDKPCAALPENLYSSLQYEIRFRAKLQLSVLCGSDYLARNMLRCQIKLIDAKTLQSAKNSKGEEPIVGGNETALIEKADKCTFQAHMTIRLNGVSYYKKKQSFKFEVSLFLANNMIHPICVMRSATFKVYSRKPSRNAKPRNKAATQNKKRKRSSSQSQQQQQSDMAIKEAEVTVHESAPKKAKNDLAIFSSKLEDLMQIMNSLSDTEKDSCVALMTDTFQLNLNPGPELQPPSAPNLDLNAIDDDLYPTPAEFFDFTF